ncbi:hypothetical protein R3P38DRAFT_3332031 [Favolaschia claudopus]|uniref:CxC2-like cysteine cluster KDZ transposase-associated domain-containing protein n=1 Tax=Favolaschia claudopus TaxID=2862362 RepID=A0AAV9ZQM9_9AGAR
MVDTEALPASGLLCTRCQDSLGIFRCDHCTGQALWCGPCCLTVNRTSPFHHPKKWNGKFFEKVDLDKIGLTIFFGHRGEPCPSLRASESVQDNLDNDNAIEDDGDEAWEDEIQTGFIGDRLRFVHTTGIFVRRVGWCCCSDEGGDTLPHDLQLLDAKMYPASSNKPSTAFTFNVLDDFALDSLECKTAALTFLTKLRRMTNSAFPLSTPNVYAAFMRCSRQFRNLKNMLRGGLAHEPDRTRAPGDLAMFCVMCPQIRKNVSLEEYEKADDRTLYGPQVVTDGNFKLDNLKMRNPQDDVRLSDGQMFCVKSAPYEDHLRITPQRKQRSGSNDHQAVNETNVKRKDVDTTGIGACACARHGCFYPHSAVGFKAGERQSNMDYSASEVIRQIPDSIKELLFIYDVVCQWVVYWADRFQTGKYLHVHYRDDLKLTAAVGKFHLGAHIMDCFWKYSLNFIQGAGEVDGEILETLWAPLDKLVGSTRNMSRAHRQEIIDEHMNDSNWKKMCGAVASLITKMDRAREGLQTVQEAFDQLSSHIGEHYTGQWEQEEQEAFQPGGIGTEIYKAEAAKGIFSLSS